MFQSSVVWATSKGFGTEKRYLKFSGSPKSTWIRSRKWSAWVEAKGHALAPADFGGAKCGFEWFVKMAVPPKSKWLWGQPKKSQTFIFLDLFGILYSTNMMQNSIESVGWGERKRLADRMNSFLVLLFRRCTASVARANYSIETELLKHRFLPRKEPAIPLSLFLFHWNRSWNGGWSKADVPLHDTSARLEATKGLGIERVSLTWWGWWMA
jgi:hypothetical protein